MATKQLSKQARFRQIHRTLAPIMVLPILLTLVTGTSYQIADLSGQDKAFDWLLQLHKGNFFIINLESIYVFLNALGLLFLAITGITMWNQVRRRPIRPTSEPETSGHH